MPSLIVAVAGSSLAFFQSGYLLIFFYGVLVILAKNPAAPIAIFITHSVLGIFLPLEDIGGTPARYVAPMLALYLLARFRSPGRIPPQVQMPIAILAILFLIASVVPISNFSRPHLWEAITSFFYLAIFCLASISAKRVGSDVYKSISLSCSVVLVVLAFYFFISGGIDNALMGARYNLSGDSNANRVGLGVALLLCFAFSFGRRARSGWLSRSVLTLGITVGYGLLLFTGSRGALLGFLIAVAIPLILGAGEWRRAMSTVLFFGVMASVSVLFLNGFESIASRFTVDDVVADGGSHRLGVNLIVLKNFTEWPLVFGFGFNDEKIQAFVLELGAYTTLHNWYLFTGLGFGVPGALLYWSSILSIVKSQFRIVGSSDQAPAVPMFLVLLVGLVENISVSVLWPILIAGALFNNSGVTNIQSKV